MILRPVRGEDLNALEILNLGLDVLRNCKPNDRSEKDRLYAIAITEQQKLIAFFYTWIFEDGKLPTNHIRSEKSAAGQGIDKEPKSPGAGANPINEILDGRDV